MPYISPGGSVIPMWLPSDLDIFCTPSVPASSGTVRIDLLRLPVGGLDRAAHQQVEGLVGAAELDVGAHGDGVVALQDGVQELEHGDRLARRPPLGEVVALEDLRDGDRAHEPEEVLHRHVQPLGVEAHLEPLVGGSTLPACSTYVRACASISSPESTGRVAERPLGSPTRAV